MAAVDGSTVLRVMTPGDVDGVLDAQEPGAVRGLGEVFPQDRYAFPRRAVQLRWLHEIEAPDIDCYVVAQLRSKGVRLAWLRVFTANPRGRRFHERLGWKQTGDRTSSSHPPFAELLRHERPLEPGPDRVRGRRRKGVHLTLHDAVAAVAALHSAHLRVDRRRAREDAASYLLVVLDTSGGRRDGSPIDNGPRPVDRQSGKVTRLTIPDAVARAGRVSPVGP